MTGRPNHDVDPFEPGSRPDGRRWYVVQSQPRRELYAVQNLEHQGFEAFLPRFRKTRRHARRSSTVLAALFPRYLFVALDLGRDRWRSVYATFGVACLLNNGGWRAGQASASARDFRKPPRALTDGASTTPAA